MKRQLLTFAILSLCMQASAQTIAEKKAHATGGVQDLGPEMQKFLVSLNKELRQQREELRNLYAEAQILWHENAEPEEYQQLLLKIKDAKENIAVLQSRWREMASRSMSQEDGYALWHNPQTTLEQLVIDYGSSDYVYLIPPEVAAIEIGISSNIPIPRSSWNEMLELILRENGVRVKELNPYLRQLSLIVKDNSNLKIITNERGDLELYPDNYRICFVLRPEPAQVRRTWLFLKKFIDPKNTILQVVGRDILIIADTAGVKEVLKIYDFVVANKSGLEYKAVSLRRVDAEEMAKVIEAIFEQMAEEPSSSEEGGGVRGSTNEEGSLRIIPLVNIGRAVFIIGTEDEIRKAEQIIEEVENQVGIAREKIVWRYKVKHSDPEELAEVLQKIYGILFQEGVSIGSENGEAGPPPCNGRQGPEREFITLPPPPGPDPMRLYKERFYQDGGYLVNPRPIEPGELVERDVNVNRDNFIVDLKSNSIVMVVVADILPKLKELLKEIDIPKKMVQIEVLLVEKRLRRNTRYGLNLLRFGTDASNTDRASMIWNDVSQKHPESRGILQLIFSGKATDSFPAWDLAYRFLMTQDDIQLNSCPSVLTVNQTPALIAIKDEISINTGIFEIPTEGTVALKDSFTRAQYGVTMSVTPTIHLHDAQDAFGDQADYVTMVSDITFDTIIPGGSPNRPDVNRRQITNEVRIADGQTVILGGLRRRDRHDGRESIPFLGEIPGLGKLFSIHGLSDEDVEMFIFITPTIIKDPSCELLEIRERELCRRPGDLPTFLRCIEQAFYCEKERLFQGWMTILLGPPPPQFIDTEGEFDGRCR